MRKITLAIFLLFICRITLSAQDTIRVACIGNSLTAGWEIPEPYPAMLGKMLGDKYKVGNFGENARTLLNNGDYPYMKGPLFYRALEFQPDIVVIKLGTNDSKPENWRYGGEFEKDMNALITIFQHLPSEPQIYLCYPAKVYGDKWGISDDTIVYGIMPVIDKIAREKQLTIIDLHMATEGMKEHFPDTVHPDSQGAAVIAETVYKAITKP